MNGSLQVKLSGSDFSYSLHNSELIAFRYIAEGVGKHRKSVENPVREEHEPQRRSYGASPNFAQNQSHGLN